MLKDPQFFDCLYQNELHYQQDVKVDTQSEWREDIERYKKNFF